MRGPTAHARLEERTLQELERAVAAAGAVCCRLPSAWSADPASSSTLLAARADLPRLASALIEHEFRIVHTPRGRALGELEFCAYEPDAPHPIRVRLGHRLIVGASPGFHLALEDDCLSGRPPGILSAPPPEIELIATIVAMTTGRARPTAGERSALERLAQLADPERVEAALRRALPSVEPTAVAACAEALRTGSAPRRSLVRGLRRALRGRAIRTRAGPVRPAAGGSLIAVVGGDGSGKSTAVAALHAWLSADFDVRKIHLGKPPWSTTTWLTRGLLKLWSVTWRLPRRRIDAEREFAETLRNVCASRDRLLAYRRARAAAAAGALVICDRFPLPNLRRMDAPAVTAGRSGLLRWLGRREAAWYAAMTPPDLTLVLDVPPDIAVERALQRGTREDPELVRKRATEVWEADWRDLPVTLLDASQPQQDVLARVKALVWSQL